MDLSKYNLLPIVIKKYITEYNQYEISEMFNTIQTLINDYKISFEHFMNEKKYKNIYKSRVYDYFRKVLNHKQYKIFIKLKKIDEKFYNFDENYKLHKRIIEDDGSRNHKMMGGGERFIIKNKEDEKKENNNKILQKILKKHESGELQLENFYNYIHDSLHLLNILQTMINPEKFVKYQEIIFIKETIKKTKFIIFMMDTILNFNSKDLHFEYIIKLQNYFYKQLKIFILIHQYNL